VNALERRVAGDWIEIREAAKDHFTLKDYFRLPETDVRIQIEKLNLAVEQGIVEYKRSSLNPLFRMLESSRYQSVGIETIENQLRYIQGLLYVILIERQFSNGTLKLSKERLRSAEGDISPEDLDLKEILKELNRRIKEEPDFGKRKEVKMILLQVGMYKKEKEAISKLLATISQDKKESLLVNFKKTFGEITNKIKRIYLEMVKEESPSASEVRNLLDLVPLRELVPGLTAQSGSVSRVRSTLLFVKEEKYKTREILLSLEEEKGKTDGLFEEESRAFDRFASGLKAVEEISTGGSSSELSRKMVHEIVYVLEKESPG
jgi:hypothetical protein